MRGRLVGAKTRLLRAYERKRYDNTGRLERIEPDESAGRVRKAAGCLALRR